MHACTLKHRPCAGSLTNLAKYPASTVQILGAEKALFRALKTKGNTPKYGLIFHSSFIGRASQKNKVPAWLSFPLLHHHHHVFVTLVLLCVMGVRRMSVRRAA